MTRHINTGNAGNRTRGEKHHRARLSEAQVAQIRRMYRPYLVGMVELSRQFGCGVSTIRDIVKGATW